MNKVKLSEEQAERFEAERTGTPFKGLMKTHFEGWKEKRNFCLNTISYEDFATAFIFGYDVVSFGEEFMNTLNDAMAYTDRHSGRTGRGEQFVRYYKSLTSASKQDVDHLMLILCGFPVEGLLTKSNDTIIRQVRRDEKND